MKKAIKYAALLSVILLIYSCEQKPQELILGIWKIQSIESTAEMNEIEKQIFKENNDELIADTEYEFTKDKLVIKQGESVNEASWEFTPDTKTLNLIFYSGGDFYYEIDELSEDKIVWREKIDDDYEYSITTILEKVK